MKISSHKMLKLINKKREVSLADLMPLIEKVFNDYRDYYPIAQLCISGYVGCEMKHGSDEHTDEKLLASILYSFATGEKRVNNFTSTSDVATPEMYMFYSTSKAELYFAEVRSKRSDRIYAMVIGVVVGIFTAIVVTLLGIK